MRSNVLASMLLGNKDNSPRMPIKHRLLRFDDVMERPPYSAQTINRAIAFDK
jgi:hypothetical protein